MTPLVEIVLLLALVVTSACVVPMYLKLKRLDRTQAEYGRIFAQSGQALDSAGAAMRSFSTEGRAILEDLTVKIDEARKILSDLEASRREVAALREPRVNGSTIQGG